MSRLKLGALGVLVAAAIFAVSGLAASAASAAFTLTSTKCSGGTSIIFCWAATATSELFELEGEEEFEALNDEPEVLLSATLGGESVHIVCTDAHAAPGVNNLIIQTEPLGTGANKNYSVKAKIKFTGCTLLEPLAKKCSIPAEKETNALTGTPLSAADVDFTAATLIEIPFTNNGTETCPVPGNKKVTGTQLCEFTNPGTDEAVHLLICLEASELLLAEQPASLLTTLEVKPANLGTDLWDIVEVG